MVLPLFALQPRVGQTEVSIAKFTPAANFESLKQSIQTLQFFSLTDHPDF